jgi:hypothetical protein
LRDWCSASRRMSCAPAASFSSLAARSCRDVARCCSQGRRRYRSPHHRMSISNTSPLCETDQQPDRSRWSSRSTELQHLLLSYQYLSSAKCMDRRTSWTQKKRGSKKHVLTRIDDVAEIFICQALPGSEVARLASRGSAGPGRRRRPTARRPPRPHPRD